MSTETELIKERLDIADVIGEYMPLRRYGQHWKGLCPFHQEKTPSFVVSPDKGIWHCFGCSAGGDLFTFIQQIEGLDFRATLRLLAERAGVALSASTPQSTDSRSRLFAALELAAKFYHEILMNQSAGKQAKAYLAQRGVTAATLKEFLIGYAPQQWDSVQKFLQHKKFTVAELEAAGLVGSSERGKHFDRFRGRIMFPIHDTQGRVVAFGGRITPWHTTGQEGKYVNSPETAIYHKRRTVYNLNRAKQAIRQQHVAIVVEGYMDVVLMVQSGIAHVVASSGTAFTPEHIEQLRRFAPTLHFAFDADAAGISAAIAATSSALQAGMRVATILFPAGQDPADVAARAPAELKSTVANPQALITVLLTRLKSDEHATRREGLLQEILPLLRQVRNIVQQGEMIQEVAAVLHVPEEKVAEALARAPSPERDARLLKGVVLDTAMPTRLTAEQRLVGLLLLEPALRSATLGQLTPDLIHQASLQGLVTRLHELSTADDFDTVGPQVLIDRLGEAQVILAEALRVACAGERAGSTDSASKESETLLRVLKQKALEQQLQALQAQLSAQATPQALREFQAIAEELAYLKAQ